MNIHLFQSGTFAPDATHRWTSSIARDKKYNILLGYSKSSATTHPSIQVAGRSIGDPSGTLGPEVTVVNGNGSQLSSQNRWGDYSAMRIDPVDNCTFWFTTEYYQINQRFDWSTDIGKFKFSNCH